MGRRSELGINKKTLKRDVYAVCGEYEILTLRQVSKGLGHLKSVKSVHVVTGPYDIVVLAEAKDMAKLTNVVVEGIHKIKGVVDTNTAIIVEV